MMTEALNCPVCNEPVKAHWQICPACETRLQELVCPGCRQPVKEKWKRCPECETALICPDCRRRLTKPDQACPHCKPAADLAADDSLTFTDRLCGIEMVRVPAGSFSMGDTFGQGIENELPVHTVDLDGFYMARYCVTQEQWGRLISDNPSRYQGPHLPVEQVTWEQACQFAERLTQAHQNQYHFALPSEAQWEFAARSAGLPELYAGGDDIGPLAWYAENSQGRTHPVGTRAPNGLGLFDMSGNVWEWCRDTLAQDAYQRHCSRNPLIEELGMDRIIRGGSFQLDAWSARCSRRLGLAADLMGPGLGFRLVMQPVT